MKKCWPLHEMFGHSEAFCVTILGGVKTQSFDNEILIAGKWSFQDKIIKRSHQTSTDWFLESFSLPVSHTKSFDCGLTTFVTFRSMPNPLTKRLLSVPNQQFSYRVLPSSNPFNKCIQIQILYEKYQIFCRIENIQKRSFIPKHSLF